LLSAQKNHGSGCIAAGGRIDISVGKALTIVSAMMADDRFDRRIGP
jgi:hypothetical protein